MIDPKYLDAIKRFEGFTAKATWDYAQSTNGFGTRAKYDGEVIDRAEAERRFKSEISDAFAVVQKFAPNLDDGTKAALTSLTFNAGQAWTRSGLGAAIQAGDLDRAREIFQLYNRAGGKELAGLTSRRVAEAAWFNGAAAARSPDAATSAAHDVDAARSTVLTDLARLSPSLNPAVSAGNSLWTKLQAIAESSAVPSPSSSGATGRTALTLDSILVLLSLLTDRSTGNDEANRRPEDRRPIDPLVTSLGISKA